MRMVSRALLPGWRSVLGRMRGQGATRTGLQHQTPVHKLCTMQVCTSCCCRKPAFLRLTTGQDPDPPPYLCYLREGCLATSSALFQFGSRRQQVWPSASFTDWQSREGTSLQRAETHLDIAKHPFPTSSLQQSCVTQQCAQCLDIRNTCTYMHTSLHLSKVSKNQERHATRCSSALACASQSAPQCDVLALFCLQTWLPTALGWQKSSRLPALQVNVFQHWLCRPLAALQHSRTDI